MVKTFNLKKPVCVSLSGHPLLLSQPSQLLQIQTPQAISGSVVTMPALSQDWSVPVAAPPVVSGTLLTPSSEDDVSSEHSLRIFFYESFYIIIQHFWFESSYP